MTPRALQGRTLPLLACGLIALAALAVYANSLSEPFVFDAAPIIARDASLRHLWPLSVPLSPPHDGSTVEGRPLLNLSLAVSYALSGTAPWAYHVLNLLIHVLAGLALFGIVRRTALRLETAATPAAAFALTVALLWTLHPLQTESVTYVIQRAESLMGLFYLLTLYFFIRATETEVTTLSQSGDAGEGLELKSPGDLRASAPLGGASGLGEHSSPETSAPNLRRSLHLQPLVFFTLSVASCLLGMATKEVMATAPLIVLLYDRTFLAGTFLEAWRRRRPYYLALGATWLLLAHLVSGSATRSGTAGLSAAIAWWPYVQTQAFALLLYLKLSFWPSPQVFDYGTFITTRPEAVVPGAVVALILIVASVAALASRRPRARLAGFCGAWFFAILAPTSLVPVATQTLAEHRLYLSLAAVAVFAVMALSEICGRRPVLFGIVAALLAASLGSATVARNRIYQSDIALWSDTAARIPGSERAHNNLGNALFLAGRVDDALNQYELALALQPENNPEVQYNLGNCFLAEGRLPEAIDRFREAVRLAPENPDGHNNLGNALARSGRLGDAAAEYEAALLLDPTKVEARFNLGNVALLLGHRDEAARDFREALRLNPNFADARAALDRLEGGASR